MKKRTKKKGNNLCYRNCFLLFFLFFHLENIALCKSEIRDFNDIISALGRLFSFYVFLISISIILPYNMSGMDLLGLGGKNSEKNTHNHVPDGACCGGDNANSSKDHPIFAAVKSG